jgi:hypothetical protein
LNFTNTPGTSYTILATTNISLAITNWANLGTTTETAAGQFQFTDTQANANKLRFYRARLNYKKSWVIRDLWPLQLPSAQLMPLERRQRTTAVKDAARGTTIAKLRAAVQPYGAFPPPGLACETECANVSMICHRLLLTQK